MKMSNGELKLKAKQALTGNYGVPAVAVLIMFGILGAIALIMNVAIIGAVISWGGITSFAPKAMVGVGIGSFILIFSFYVLILFSEYMMIPGFIKIYNQICKKEPVKVSHLFYGLQNGFGKFARLALILIGVFACLFALQWVLLLLAFFIGPFLYMVVSCVVTFYLSLNFGMVYFILVEDTQLSLMDAFKLSKAYMYGNKWRLFVLGLSFIGWFLLSILTFSVAFLWLIPYMGCTSMFFYLDIKEEYRQKQSQSGSQGI